METIGQTRACQEHFLFYPIKIIRIFVTYHEGAAIYILFNSSML